MLECGTNTLNCTTFLYSHKIADSPPYTAPENQRTVSSKVEQLNCNPKLYPYRDSHAIQGAVENLIEFFNWAASSKLPRKEAVQNFKLLEGFWEAADHGNLDKLTKIWFNWWYNESIIEILRQNPANTNHWNTLRRCPVPIEYDADKHQSFKVAMSKLYHECIVSTATPSFDKDIPAHILMIKEMAIIRCQNFGLSFNDKSFNRVQHIAGHITPSIITTTACASALICFQLYVVAAQQIDTNTTATFMTYSANLAKHSYMRKFLEKGGKTYGVVEVNVPVTATMKQLKEIISKTDPVFFKKGLVKSIQIVTDKGLVWPEDNEQLSGSIKTGVYRLRAKNTNDDVMMIRCIVG
eukprot:TRINITY_DN2638_c0_g2_i1.p1 TRINITY_DN2638_c0_g2~~TRINITY_DN2638_c0_g2_i1.p1  ORF type:complete len:389 (-),score=72.22 TRINITY_DN2638_c0_g2_i1:33-1088(-)